MQCLGGGGKLEDDILVADELNVWNVAFSQ